MTDAAIVRNDRPPFGRTSVNSTIIPSAVLCALVVAVGASLIHETRSPTPVAKSPVADSNLQVPARIVDHPHPAPRPAALPAGISAEQLAIAARLLASGSGRIDGTAPTSRADSSAALRGTAMDSATEALDRRETSTSLPQIVTAMRTAADNVEGASVSERGGAGQAETVPVPPERAGGIPGSPGHAEQVPVPPSRPTFLAVPREEALPPRRDETLPPRRDEAAPPQREQALPAPREETPRRSGRRRLARQTTASPDAGPEDNRNFLEKLFNVPASTVRATAYAPSDGGLGGIFGRKPSYDGQTAIYDISAHTVYLPNGTRLEAHSGLGANLDNPGSAHHPNRGATPPAVYALTLREDLFHGVQALRLTPIGSAKTYGRNGFLAHTYMLGARGDSNGCVVFRNYDAFLQAYNSGVIKRLAVVASMN